MSWSLLMIARYQKDSHVGLTARELFALHDHLESFLGEVLEAMPLVERLAAVVYDRQILDEPRGGVA